MPVPPLKIVIADDERDMRDFLQKVLPLLGHSVVAVAENGVELVSVCTQARPDLIITDLKMPERDGLSALQEIWQTHPVPAIVISAFPEEVSQGPLGASPWLTLLVKPVRMSDLMPAIDRAIERIHAGDSTTIFDTENREAE